MKGSRAYSTAFIAVGSNLGDRIKHLHSAFDLLEGSHDTTITASSQLYESKPMYMLEQDSFLNGVIKVRPFCEVLVTGPSRNRFLRTSPH